MSALCVIPARGGSKRVPRKNVRPFAGKPMLAHALTAVLESRAFDRVHVSTEDEEIARVAAEYGAQPVFFRDDTLSDDVTPIRDVVRQDWEEFAARGEAYETVALVYATAALLQPSDIHAAMVAFRSDRSTPLLCVTPAQTPLERFMAIQEGHLRSVVAAERFANRTQDLTTVYRDAGAMAVYSAATLGKDTDGAKAMAFRPHILPAHKAVDIDTEDDWRHAEIIRVGLDALGG